ncbi:MAG TPA: DUF3883 domain-containing protein [Terracidiphilus sp.]|jgi:hypothetical protein
MIEESKRGTNWQDDELDAIVADYFSMLVAEFSGQAYIKSRHSAALMTKIGRTHRSVEFKHQNISAVLNKLGMPWIPGYKPKFNFQNAIIDAVDRYISKHPGILEPEPILRPVSPLPSEVFVAPPAPGGSTEKIPERLNRLVAKFDPVERDHLNRSLGKAGESFVVDLERHRLEQANRADLARRVRWTAAEDGDGAGYDVSSFTVEGKPRFIEVKTTNGSAHTPFFITRNEFSVARESPAHWQIYRVYLFASGPRIFTIAPPLEDNVRLSTETWRASF